jgi:hypothetical protein
MTERTEEAAVAELQELLTTCANACETLTKRYTALLEQHGALTMVMGVLVGCFRAYDPDFAPRMILGLQKIVSERGDALSEEQRQFLDDFAAAVLIEPGVTGSVNGVATH